MGVLRKLESRLSRYAVPQLTLILSIGQGLFWALGRAQPELMERLKLIPAEVAAGEYWRLVSFLFMPEELGILWIFGLYLFYLMGSALEATWGDFRYNLYIFIAWIATVAVAYLSPFAEGTSAYIGGSVFLAFAFLYPDFEILLFFILPVKVKWLALLTWIGYAYVFLFGSWAAAGQMLAAVANFFLFFHKEVFLRMRSGRRRMETRIQTIRNESRPFHRCEVCGITERDDKRMEFRYCSKCHGNHEYCSVHLPTHEHVAEPAPPVSSPES